MNYSETLRYLFQALPMFHRIGDQAIRPDLDNIREICTLLGNPQETFKTIHIAGTNGKGSTSHMLAAILQASNYKTGLYTSPHLKDFRERIRINGSMIPKSRVTSFIKKNRSAIEQIKPSFFEMTVALAFEHFALEKVDIAVIETGLGGRLDSTNIITPLLSVITNIGYDHMNLLGNRLEEIAAEKAGIIKEGVPVVIGEYMPQIADIFNLKAKKFHSPIRFASLEYETISRNEHLYYQEVVIQHAGEAPQKYKLDLKGNYQVKNLKTLLCSANELQKLGYKLNGLKDGIRQVQKITNLRGRWTTISRNPLIICDTGHNADGLREVVDQIKSTTFKKLHMVIGVVKDKEISSMLALLPKDAEYYFCKADIPRAQESETLRKQALDFGLNGKSYPSTFEALNAAKHAASAEDLIFIGGSTFVVGELIS